MPRITMAAMIPPAMLNPRTILEVDSVDAEAEGVLVAVAEATGKENGRIEKDWLGVGEGDGSGEGDGDGGGGGDGDGAIGEGATGDGAIGDGTLFVGCTVGLGSSGGNTGDPSISSMSVLVLQNCCQNILTNQGSITRRRRSLGSSGSASSSKAQ